MSGLSDEPEKKVLAYARQVRIHQVSEIPYTGWDWSDRTLWFVVLIVGVPVVLIGLLAIAGAVWSQYWWQ
jgi:hypothetical protein